MSIHTVHDVRFANDSSSLGHTGAMRRAARLDEVLRVGAARQAALVGAPANQRKKRTGGRRNPKSAHDKHRDGMNGQFRRKWRGDDFEEEAPTKPAGWLCVLQIHSPLHLVDGTTEWGELKELSISMRWWPEETLDEAEIASSVGEKASIAETIERYIADGYKYIADDYTPNGYKAEHYVLYDEDDQHGPGRLGDRTIKLQFPPASTTKRSTDTIVGQQMLDKICEHLGLF